MGKDLELLQAVKTEDLLTVQKLLQRPRPGKAIPSHPFSSFLAPYLPSLRSTLFISAPITHPFHPSLPLLISLYASLILLYFPLLVSFAFSSLTLILLLT
ncbi:hypothetical protein PAMA_008913 [Pampus argenteus]